jgi:hypothetical protein
MPKHETFVEEVMLAPSERAIVDVLFDTPGSVTLEHRTPAHAYDFGTIVVADDRSTCRSVASSNCCGRVPS